MIVMKAEVIVSGLSGRKISDFMLHCIDEDYQNWWPGTHLSFHTTRRFSNDIGNLVYFDEYVGKHRVMFNGVVVRNITGKVIVWQMKKAIKLPAWMVLEFNDSDDGVVITHTLKVGFTGVGRLLDPILRLYLSTSFEKELEEHTKIEFTKLAAILA